MVAELKVKRAGRLTTAQQKRVADNLGLVHAYVRRNGRMIVAMKIDEDEAMSTCSLALVNAARGFDPDRGFQFSTYAWRAMKLGLLQAAKRSRSVADKAGVREIRIDAAPADSRPLSVGDPRIVEVDGPIVAAEVIAVALPQLEYRSRAVLRMRYLDGRTLAFVAGRLGLTSEGVRQIEVKALAKCREVLAGSA